MIEVLHEFEPGFYVSRLCQSCDKKSLSVYEQWLMGEKYKILLTSNYFMQSPYFCSILFKYLVETFNGKDGEVLKNTRIKLYDGKSIAYWEAINTA